MHNSWNELVIQKNICMVSYLLVMLLLSLFVNIFPFLGGSRVFIYPQPCDGTSVVNETLMDIDESD